MAELEGRVARVSINRAERYNTVTDRTVDEMFRAFYDAGGELGILWNDPDIGIEWPIDEPLLSGKDAEAPRLRDVMDKLPDFAG